jgi:hypothetical protein
MTLPGVVDTDEAAPPVTMTALGEVTTVVPVGAAAVVAPPATMTRLLGATPGLLNVPAGMVIGFAPPTITLLEGAVPKVTLPAG